MKLTSPGFKNNSTMPSRYTMEGANVSPALEWSEVPEGCKSFVLLCDDLDAPKKYEHAANFVHWLIFNISGDVSSLPEGLLKNSKLELPVKATQGTNSFGRIGYDGPLPPAGSGPHRYTFRLFACDRMINVKPGSNRNTVMESVQSHSLETAQLTATYERRLEQEIETNLPID